MSIHSESTFIGAMGHGAPSQGMEVLFTNKLTTPHSLLTVTLEGFSCLLPTPYMYVHKVGNSLISGFSPEELRNLEAM